MSDERPKVRTTMFDAPWQESGGGASKRGADRHYRLLGKNQIVKVILADPLWDPADNAHLYMWATNNHLGDALWVMDALGFRYVTNVAWVKVKRGFTVKDLMEMAQMVMAGKIIAALKRVFSQGLGQYFRGEHELLLFGVRGKGDHEDVKTAARDIPSVIFAEKGAHSEKPEEAYDLIERRSHGPYVEMFARTSRKGWSSSGEQLDMPLPSRQGDLFNPPKT
jgi:N6-adenosine-specific RNA methylase IME4